MAELISIKTDMDEVERFLSTLDGNRYKMQRRVLSGIGTAARNTAKRAYRSLLSKQSGTLYKSLYSKLVRSGKAVIVAPSAIRDKVRYGFVLAKGATIRAKEGGFLTFRIGDKWVRKHEVTIKPHDFVEGPVKAYLSSQGYREKLDALMRKEVERAEKAAAGKQG